MLASEIFREYDIRGNAEQQLTSDGVAGLGRAIGTFLRRTQGPNVALGRDVRLSSPRLHDALLEGLLATGCHVTDLGPVPTPLLYYSTRHLRSHGAVMITGSHNPKEFNGFKVVAGESTIHGAEIQQVLGILSGGDFETHQGSVVTHDILPDYVKDVAARFDFRRRLKVVIDNGNGAGGTAARALFSRLNVDTVEMFFEPDGNFPNHHPDPTVEANLEPLRQKVRETGADFGIAFDGDTDRIGVVDEEGRVIWGDLLMLIYGRDILKTRPGATFIGEVKCSQVMYDLLEQAGGHPIMFKTGHSLIKAEMKRTGAVLAGEMSGHMFFADRYYGFDDALYAACRLIEVVAASDRPLSALLADVPPMVNTPEIRVDCPDNQKAAIVERTKEILRSRYPLNDMDGVRVRFPHGWGLVRASNTQAILVMRFEAATPELLAAYRTEIEAAVEQARRAD